jgi:hypothetical protein
MTLPYHMSDEVACLLRVYRTVDFSRLNIIILAQMADIRLKNYTFILRSDPRTKSPHELFAIIVTPNNSYYFLKSIVERLQIDTIPRSYNYVPHIIFHYCYVFNRN